MEIYQPLTIDLRKDQQYTKEYGIDHINKLLEQELEHLKSLKSQKPSENLPVLMPNNKSGQVEGLKDYKKRVQQSKSRGCQKTKDDKINDRKPNIGPFSEMNHDFTRDGRITGKGEVPFFKVAPDRTSLSYKLPRLLDSQVPKTASYQPPTTANQRNQSRKTERTKRSSGKLVSRSRGKLLKNDSFTSDSDYDDITDSLKVNYCTITARHSFEQEKEEKSLKKESIFENKTANKTFHLACTRNPSRYQPIRIEDRQCSFCAASVNIHARSSQNEVVKNGRSSTRKPKTAEKPFLPQIIKTEITPKKEEVKHECAKCRKRFEQAEQNKISLAVASSQRKRETSNLLSRKAKSRPVTKERKPTGQTQEDARQRQQANAGVLECAAYVHEDGSLSLLPGAFILRNNDYNMWSRTPSVKTSQQNLTSNSSLPRLVQ